MKKLIYLLFTTVFILTNNGCKKQDIFEEDTINLSIQLNLNIDFSLELDQTTSKSSFSTLKTDSEFNHVIDDELTITFTSDPEGYSNSLTFDPSDSQSTISLPYGNYNWEIESSIVSGTAISQKLPVYGQSSSTVLINQTDVNLDLVVQTDYSLITVNTEHVSSVLLKHDDDSINLDSKDGFFYGYVSSGSTSFTLEVTDKEGSTITTTLDSVESCKEYKYTLNYSDVNVNSLVCLCEPFEVIERFIQPSSFSCNLEVVKLIENSRNLIKTSDSNYIVRTQDDVLTSNSIDGNFTDLNFNINVQRGDIHGHLLGETSNNSILISTKDDGIFKLENSTWSSSGLSGFGTSGNDFLKLESGRILIAKQGYLRKLYYSDNNGVTWNTSSGSENEDWRDFSIISNGKIFIGSPGSNVGGVLRSVDDGESFQRIRTQKCLSTSTYQDEIYIISIDDDGQRILMKSNDDGDTWNDIFTFNDFKSGGYVEIIFFSENIVVLNDEKIYCSPIDNINFSETILPSDIGLFREVSYIDDKVYAIYDSGIYLIR